MRDEIRSFPRWVTSVEGAAVDSGLSSGIHFNLRADIVVRTPETRNVDFPGVGAKMVGGHGETVTIEGVPFVSARNSSIVVPINTDNGPMVVALSYLRPYKPAKKYIAVYEGTSEADVRERCKVPEGVRLEEKP